jgi:hypothetical protein
MDEVWYQAPDWATTNPLALLVYGFAGGLVVALLLLRLNRWTSARAAREVPHGAYISVDVINLAHIRVVGAGGLGLVAVCALAAVYIPAIGWPLAGGCLLGTAGAILVIRRRRRIGPISSSSKSPGANTTLMIDGPGQTPEGRP